MKLKFRIFIASILFMIFLNLFSISAREITCADDPLALWQFEEGNGTDTNDSCYNYTCSIYGVPHWITGMSNFGNALDFYYDEVDNNLQCGYILQGVYNDYSLSLWVNLHGRNIIDSDNHIFELGMFGDVTTHIEMTRLGGEYFDYWNTGYTGNTMLYYSNDTIGDWHYLVNTFNSTDGNFTFYLDGVPVASQINSPYTINITDSLYMSASHWDWFAINGSIDDVAFFNRTLTEEEISDFYYSFNCSAQNNSFMTLYVNNYPYVDLNTSYGLSVSLLTDGTSNPFTDIGIRLQNSSGSSFVFNFTWDVGEQLYKTNLTFLTSGYYSFAIFPYTDCKTANITGTFRVFEPYYVTLRLFELKDKTNTTAIYKNDFSYAIAYFKNQQTEEHMENFVIPLTFKLLFNQSTFHSPYTSGIATLKLYEPRSHILRLIDGNINFENEYSVPNITKSYGTNIYLGDFNFNGTNASYDIYLTEREIKPFSYILNWILIIGILFCVIVGTFMFFVIPNKPSLSIILGLGGTIMLSLLRIALWYWLGI